MSRLQTIDGCLFLFEVLCQSNVPVEISAAKQTISKTGSVVLILFNTSLIAAVPEKEAVRSPDRTAHFLLASGIIRGEFSRVITER
ncbi:hypothetical protein CEXT_342901 [Caerostris extrusa]|uniref:Uncharacterized protein n=1 Tax=Caerostris extrusa TaxID=172846 RepID=A0AAV4SE48_CAEEX|nr:hypothetical protein CEXT_342901 [Caerostris extrusa]